MGIFGGGLRLLQTRQQIGPAEVIPKGLFNQTPEEYAEKLRHSGYSERAIVIELALFKEIKAQRGDAKTRLAEARKARRQRPVEDEELDEYVKAEIRRQAGVVADDIIKEFQEATK